ncbi:MAG: hypothetical protein QXF26_05060 [Candidatus Bathyarchaeia archaeon]
MRYPRLSLLAGTYVLVLFLASFGFIDPTYVFISGLGFFGFLLSGFLYAYAFTSASATAILLHLSRECDLLISGLTAGLGALLGDILIFLLVRRGLNEELKALSNLRVFQLLIGRISTRVRRFIFPIVAGLLISSPLPTEIGVAVLASSSNVSTRVFLPAAYLLHTAGIFTIILAGKLFF